MVHFIAVKKVGILLKNRGIPNFLKKLPRASLWKNLWKV